MENRYFAPFKSLSAPPTLPVFVYWCAATTSPLRPYLPRQLWMFAPIYALSSLHICAYLCPTTSARLRLSIPRQQCPFMPISSPPTISVYHFSSISDPSTQCRLCQIYIFLTLHFLVYIYINNCGHVYPITSISPRQQYLFRLSLPKALHFYGLSLPTSCAHFCQSHLIHTTLCVYMPRYLCQFASISAPTPLHVCAYL